MDVYAILSTLIDAASALRTARDSVKLETEVFLPDHKMELVLGINQAIAVIEELERKARGFSAHTQYAVHSTSTVTK